MWSSSPTIATELFGVKYGAPFGIAPIGQSGFIWPGAEKILAKTAADFSIPYCLSTVAAQSIETIGPLTKGMGWFQLYPPRDLGIMEEAARATSFVVDGLSDSDPEVRLESLKQVRDIGGDGAIHYLETAALDPDPSVSAMAQTILDDLAAKM